MGRKAPTRRCGAFAPAEVGDVERDEQTELHEVAHVSLGRAVRILQGVALEAERRGYAVSALEHERDGARQARAYASERG